MMPYTSLRQKVNEVFSDFLRYYPIYEEFRKEILEMTERRVSKRLVKMSGATLERYFIGHQLRADITVEITKVAMLMKEFPEPIASIVLSEPIVSKTTLHFAYEKRGNVVYLPYRFGVSLS
ncbi:MAG: hypothetical protein H6Q63_198 [Firmicutes bacterium]|nr:hypothetical protein [Bacillota bacterium]